MLFWSSGWRASTPRFCSQMRQVRATRSSPAFEKRVSERRSLPIVRTCGGHYGPRLRQRHPLGGRLSLRRGQGARRGRRSRGRPRGAGRRRGRRRGGQQRPRGLGLHEQPGRLGRPRGARARPTGSPGLSHARGPAAIRAHHGDDPREGWPGRDARGSLHRLGAGRRRRPPGAPPGPGPRNQRHSPNGCESPDKTPP